MRVADIGSVENFSMSYFGSMMDRRCSSLAGTTNTWFFTYCGMVSCNFTGLDIHPVGFILCQTWRVHLSVFYNRSWQKYRYSIDGHYSVYFWATSSF